MCEREGLSENGKEKADELYLFRGAAATVVSNHACVRPVLLQSYIPGAYVCDNAEGS